ncbi:hypothetical protein QQ73_03860 [Candidatus Endoriftia persephone str. Guaymas]|nr:hypothetical protein [Candidatus Endoriftia persephone str. Guaymas]
MRTASGTRPLGRQVMSSKNEMTRAQRVAYLKEIITSLQPPVTDEEALAIKTCRRLLQMERKKADR